MARHHKNKLKITFNKQNTTAHNYLSSTLKKTNNLAKLHEFENYLLVKQKQTHEVTVRREKNMSNLRSKSGRGNMVGLGCE